MRRVLFFLLAILFLYQPFRRGLFFSQDHYLISFLICFLFVFWSVLLFVQFKRKIKSNKANGMFDSPYIWLFLLPFVYVATFAVAASPAGNADHLIAWTSYICFLLMLLWVRHDKQIEKWFSHVFGLMGGIISFFALAGVWGWTDYQDVMVGDRTTGPFQYANTFAVIVGAFWIFALAHLSKTRPQWPSLLLFVIPLTASVVGFLHSYSRGAWLLIPIVWFIGLFCLRFREQLLYVLYTAFSFLSGIFVFRNMVAQEQSGASTPGLLAVVIGTIFMIAIGSLHLVLGRKMDLERLLNRWDSHRWLRLVMPVFSLSTGALLVLDLIKKGFIYGLLPQQIQERVSNINLGAGSVLGRLHVYRDAWMISKQSPLLGYGGEGWKFVYGRYQSLPYYNNEIHNGYLDILLNTGWIGFSFFAASLLGLFVLLFFRTMQEQDQELRANAVGSFLSLLFIFAHAGIDFDFSFGSVWFIVFYLFSMGVSLHPRGFSKNKLKILMSRSQFLHWSSKAWRLCISILALIVVFFSIRFYEANRAVAKLYDQTGAIDVNMVLDQYSYASKMNPLNVDYLLGLADVHAFFYETLQRESDLASMLEALNRAESLEPGNSFSLMIISSLYMRAGMIEEAEIRLEKALDHDRHNVNIYDRLLDVKHQELLHEQSVGRLDQAVSIAKEMVSLYEEYSAWFERWKNVTIPDRRPLRLDKMSYFYAANAYRAVGEREKALELLRVQGFVFDSEFMENELSSNEPFKLVKLRDVLEGYQDHIIILSVRNDAMNKMGEENKTYLRNLGSRIDELGYKGSYVAVLNKGQLVFEKIDNHAAIEINAENHPELGDIFLQKPFSIRSAGYDKGDASSIIIDGVEYSKKKRGVNVAIFDLDMNPILSTYFDTHMSETKVEP